MTLLLAMAKLTGMIWSMVTATPMAMSLLMARTTRSTTADLRLILLLLSTPQLGMVMARLTAMLCMMVLSTATGMLCMDLATLATDMEDMVRCTLDTRDMVMPGNCLLLEGLDMVRCTLDTRDMAMPGNCLLLEGLDMLLKTSLPDSSTKMPGILVMDLRMSPTL